MKTTINGHELFYEDYGNDDGFPVVFVHGFPLNHTMWDQAIASLPEDFLAITYDIRGHGQSAVGDGQYSVEFFVDDLIGLLDHMSVDKAVICGLSMGGYITLRAYERHPERFAGMVLCDTQSFADSDEGRLKRAAGIKTIKTNGLQVFAEGLIKALLSENTFEKNEDLVNELLAVLIGNDPIGTCGTLLALASRTDTTDVLKSIDVPVAIIVGEHDILTPPSVARVMQENIRDAELHIIPDAGHMSNMENPEEFNGKLNAFLDVFIS